jgi:indolepyruvate ferredoxin oxidoreductase, alpha subunit
MFIPVIDDDKCDNCKACAKICPKIVFESDDESVQVANPIFCTGCESCSAVCPKNALKIQDM